MVGSAMLACPGYRLRGHRSRKRACDQLMRLRNVRIERSGHFAAKETDSDSCALAAKQQTAPAMTPEDDGQAAKDGPNVEMTPPVGHDDDLTQLPGAGEGLVWMLHQRDIRSFTDLAALRAEQLAQMLGPLGQLVDVAGWIDHARQCTSMASAEVARPSPGQSPATASE